MYVLGTMNLTYLYRFDRFWNLAYATNETFLQCDIIVLSKIEMGGRLVTNKFSISV